MTDPGLNQRLRQRSRRSGLMIGFSMLLTLVVCVGAFTMIYARLEPVVADFVGRGDIVAPTPIPTAVPVAQAPQEPAATETEASESTDDDSDSPAQGGDNQIESADNDPDEFIPDYQNDAGQSVNLRPGPSISSGAPVMALPMAAPLMYLGEEQPTEDPEGDQMESGQVWMKFRTEDGSEGWVREIDVSEYEP